MGLKLYSFAALLLIVAVPAQAQNYPSPTAEQQKGIDKDTSRHFGDAVADPGPLATDLSPELTTAALDRAIRKVADWELARAEPYFDRIWTWSVLYSGFMAASEATSDAKYRDAMTRMSEKYKWELRSALPNADDQSIAQTYIELALRAGKDPAMLAGSRRGLDAVIALPTLRQGDARIPWWWCDALFMAPPAWARLYAATGGKQYLEYIDRQWQQTSKLLYDPAEHLYARDATYISRRGKTGKKIFWSRGEGWVMAGIARTVAYLPPTWETRPFYITQLQEMARRIKELPDSDGLWHSDLLDPESYPLPELSGSTLFIYALAWGINEGVLPRAEYYPVVAKAWAGTLRHVYASGRLGCIQQTGAEPALYTPSASYNYGVGGYLLAASELRRMAVKSGAGTGPKMATP